MSKEKKDLIFVAYGSSDEDAAKTLVSLLEENEHRCWAIFKNAASGVSISESITGALHQSNSIVWIRGADKRISIRNLATSAWTEGYKLPVIEYLLGNPSGVEPKKGKSPDGKTLIYSVETTPEESIKDFIKFLHKQVPATIPKPNNAVESNVTAPKEKPKGYVFISYVQDDSDFIAKLRNVLEMTGYAYWDYQIGSRDYHGTLYRELEERIDGAEAFITIVSDAWRTSEWVAAEFIYAREAEKPIFVVQAKNLAKPLPILLNLQTRIDMSADFDGAAKVLAEALTMKGL